ncbi:phage tail protein [Enterobacter sp. 22466]|uniref:phage tail protein n=1 Tax=Enterobacter sp. 22466 TaxID=3453924 RepID=UPI003F82756D
MAEKYYSILTNRGKELEAESAATGKPVVITDFVVGDGNGAPVIPDPVRTALMNEVYRSAVSALQVSPDQANQFIAQLVLPADVGGFVVREVGLLTEAGELYSLANCAAIEKPEKSVSIRMQYRLAVSETADIELKVATGDGLFLRQDANLGDVKDAAESRENIGLKGAAVLDVGKTAGTVAAGDDTRIVNALQKNNNLSDLTDKAKAREHLELKTAAQKEVVTSMTDTTANRVPVVGWMGLGSVAPRTAVAASDSYDNIPTGLPSGFWTHAVGGGPYAHTVTLQQDGGGNRNDIHLIIPTGTGNKIAIRWDGGQTKSYQYFYTDKNKPTAGDVGALPTGGGRLTGTLEIYHAAPIIQLTETDTGKKYFIVVDGSGFRIDEDSTAGDHILSYASGSKQLTTGGQFVPGDFSNFDARYLLADSATHAGFASGDATRPYMRHKASNAVVELAKKGDAYTKAESDNGYMAKTGAYTKTESDGRFQPKGNYAAAGASYTKAESDARYSQINTASKTANSMYSKDASTGVITIAMSNITVGNNASVAVTFPTAFPNACVATVISYDGNGHGNDSDSAYAVTAYSKTGCTIQAWNANGKFMLIATGY